MLGPLFGGVLLSFTSPDGAYWFNAVTFVVSALLISASRSDAAIGTPCRTDIWPTCAKGFGLVRSPALLAVLVGWGLAALAVGASGVAGVKLAKDVLDGENFGLGLLMAASGFGLIIGSLGADWGTRRFGTAPRTAARSH